MIGGPELWPLTGDVGTIRQRAEYLPDSGASEGLFTVWYRESGAVFGRRENMSILEQCWPKHDVGDAA